MKTLIEKLQKILESKAKCGDNDVNGTPGSSDSNNNGFNQSQVTSDSKSEYGDNEDNNESGHGGDDQGYDNDDNDDNGPPGGGDGGNNGFDQNEDGGEEDGSSGSENDGDDGSDQNNEGGDVSYDSGIENVPPRFSYSSRRLGLGLTRRVVITCINVIERASRVEAPLLYIESYPSSPDRMRLSMRQFQWEGLVEAMPFLRLGVEFIIQGIDVQARVYLGGSLYVRVVTEPPYCIVIYHCCHVDGEPVPTGHQAYLSQLEFQTLFRARHLVSPCRSCG